MILLLHPPEYRNVVEAMRAGLLAAFNDHVAVELHPADQSGAWGQQEEWDDLLIVAFDEKQFPSTGNDYINDYLQKHAGKGLLLPVAISPANARPPLPAEAIKAIPFPSTSHGNVKRFVKRVGALIGLRVQQRQNEVFISYRTSDGATIAVQLEEHLTSIGYPVWRDEAKEIDGETKILPGSPVQNEIDDALAKASIMLLVDTPDAPHSRWIAHEVDTANGMLLPVLPLCFRPSDDRKKGPRFQSLLHHQRWIELPMRDGSPSPPLESGQLDSITHEMEDYLCELIQRKCRVPFIVEKEFVARKFTWNIVDKKLLVAESVKGKGTRFPIKVLSHCSIFDYVHVPGMKAFADFMAKTGRPNFSLYIYDGEMIPEPQLAEFVRTNPSEDNVFVLHHQELAALLDSSFAMKVV